MADLSPAAIAIVRQFQATRSAPYAKAVAKRLEGKTSEQCIAWLEPMAGENKDRILFALQFSGIATAAEIEVLLNQAKTRRTTTKILE